MNFITYQIALGYHFAYILFVLDEAQAWILTSAHALDRVVNIMVALSFPVASVVIVGASPS
ncbi:hypothetical protein ACUXIZ_002970 [Cytobacillus horneckiae]